MLRVNEYVNAVQNDTSNGWDDGATDDGSSSQPEPGSYASTWDMLLAGDIDGLYEKASDNPISRSDLWKNDIKPGIVEPFITGASQAVNEWSRAQQQETDAFKEMIDNIATGADQDAVNSSINNYNDASQYVTDAGKLVMEGPLSLIPSVGVGTFVGDAINKGIEEENPIAAIRAATYGPAVDYASQDNLMDKIIERPVTTLGEGAMSVLPLIGAGYVGYKGGKKVYDNRQAIGDFASDARNEGVGNAVFDRTAGRNFDDAGDNYVHSNDGVDTTRQEPQAEPQDYTQEQPAAEPAEQPTFSTGVDSNVDAMVANAAAKYQVDPALLAKLVDQESTYGRDANAGGNLAQISDDLARQYGLDSSDPAQSIEGGARYLKEQLDNNNGDAREALAAYNGGPGAPNYNYADQVLARDIGGEMGKSYSGGNGGEGAYEAGADAWMGATMPHGSDGCVEAATRVGSFYDGFLKDEAEKGVASVPQLISDAGDRFIPFDESRLEKGDIIVYGGDEHVVTYDGKGGYVGNSTSQGHIVHGDDYHAMGGMEPTGIIKASDKSGGDGYIPETDGGNDTSSAINDENVDVFGNKLDEEPSDEQPQTDNMRSNDDAVKPVEDTGKPADVNWGDDEPVTLYRGEQGNLENGRHLSRERNVFDVIGRNDPNAKEDSSAPLTYYTESMDDAGRYANADQAGLQAIRERLGKNHTDKNGNWVPYTDADYIDIFKTVFGHTPRANGKVNTYNVRLGKVLDMSDLGERPSYYEMEKKILDIAGLKRTTNADKSHPDWDLIDNRLKLSDMYGDADNAPAYMILKNNPRESINRADEFIKFAQENGYRTIKYKEDGVNHYAVIDTPKEKGLPTKPQQDNIPPERVQEVKNLDSYMGVLQAERQRMIDEEVNFYKDTPGGKGTQTGTIVDDTGRVTGRFSESYNPQWYQDAYKYFGKKPPKSRLPEFAEDYLSKNSEEFSKIDLQIRQLQEYRDRITKQPTADSGTTAKQVLNDIQFSKAIKAENDKAINDNLPDLKEKDTPAEKPKHSRGPARFVEEQPEKRGFIANDVIPTVKGAVDFAKTAKDEIQKVIAPSTMGKDSKLTAQNMREFLSDMAHKGNMLEHSLGDVQKYFEKHPEQSIPFISKMERGERMSDPKLQAFADSMRKIMDARAQEVRDLGTGQLEHFIKNYFPHIWKDEEKAGSFSAAWLGKRPFEGKKSFLKKRTVPTIAEGIKAGLEPITRNPADLVIMKMREMDKYIMAHKTIEAERKAARGKWVRDVQGEEAPDGWKKVDDKIAVKYGPPAVDVREAYDPAIMDTLNHVCDTLNIKHTRDTVLKADGKRVASGTWGYASSDGKIGTKFGGPESVLAHEIGHQLDYKYHVYDIMRSDPTKLRIGNSNKYTTAGKEMQREFEILADKRMDPNDMNNAHRKYVQGGTEPMAAVIEAYVHAPEMLKETAPVIYKSLMKFFKAHPELNDLRDIKPSLRLKENRGEQPINGLVTLGHFYMPANSARLINNYLSPGLRDKSAIFRGYLGISNVMNLFQLALSAFHLGLTSLDSTVSKTALSIIKASHGDIFSALANTLHAPIAPVENAMRGNKLYKEWMSPGSQGAKEGKLLDSLIAGGGRVKMDKMYQTNLVDTMRKAFRQGNYVGASARIPFALMEMSVKPILEFVVPRQKLGIFADAMQYELKRKPDMTHEELQDVAGKIWNSVDNRLGQLCYDNLFWHKTLKDILMAVTRSVGWNLGTWRELGGAAVDAGKYAGKALKNRSLSNENTGGITYRMSYAIALPVTVGMLGAITQYLYTGQGPNDMKDLFYPRTGTLDKNGRPQRIELPSYMKDLAAYYDHPGRTLENKLHPMLSSIADMLHNKDYYGKEIYHKDDDAGKKAIDIMSYLAQQFVPFSVRGSKYNADLGGSFLSKALPFFGITPAPADVNKTEVEKKMDDIMAGKRPVGSRTQEESDKADLRNTILRDLQTSNGTDRTSLNNAYMNKQIDKAEKTRLLNEYKLSPLQRQASELGPDEIKNLMKDATSEERPVLEGIYNKKLKNQQKRQ